MIHDKLLRRFLSRFAGGLARLPLLSLLSLGLLVLVTFLWIDGRRQSRVLQLAVGTGTLQALGSDRAGIVVFISDIPFGRERALTADLWPIPADEAKVLRDSIFENANKKWGFAGWRYAERTWRFSAIQTCHSQSLLVPYWFLVPLLAMVPGRVVHRVAIRIGRQRRGACVECGYDLRHCADRCPECGRSKIAEITELNRPSLIRLSLGSLLLAGLLCALPLLFHHATDCAHDEFEPMERRAGLDRKIPQIHLSGITVAQAIDDLARMSGTRITLDPKLAAQTVYTPLQNFRSVTWGQRPANYLDSQDVMLASLLHLITLPEANGYPAAGYAANDDGTIVINYEDALPHVLRTYDVRDVLAKLGRPKAHGGSAWAGRGISILGGSVIRPYDQPERQLVAMMASPHVSYTTPLPQIAWCSGGRLAVMETRRGHARVRKLLDQLRAMSPVWQSR